MTPFKRRIQGTVEEHEVTIKQLRQRLDELEGNKRML